MRTNLRTDLRKYICRRNFKILALLIGVFSIIFSTSIYPNPQNNTGDESKKYILRNGKIYKAVINTIDELPVTGFVRNIFCNNNEIYYIKTASDKDEELYLGLINFESGKSYEFKSGINIPGMAVKRFFGGSGIIYIFAAGEAKPGTLYRVDINSMSVSSKTEVFDFILYKNIPVLVLRRDRIFYLNINNEEIPLAIYENVTIKNIIDDRLLLLSGGNNCEMIDLVNLKSMYMYSGDKKYSLPDKYNLIVEACDSTGVIDDKRFIFYKIFIDGHESGRTETGVPSIPAVFRAKKEANTYHVITLERWELNRAKGKYDRSNNIYQPAPLKILTPENRIIKLRVIFDGKGYSFQKSIDFE